MAVYKQVSFNFLAFLQKNVDPIAREAIMVVIIAPFSFRLALNLRSPAIVA